MLYDWVATLHNKSYEDILACYWFQIVPCMWCNPLCLSIYPLRHMSGIMYPTRCVSNGALVLLSINPWGWCQATWFHSAGQIRNQHCVTKWWLIGWLIGALAGFNGLVAHFSRGPASQWPLTVLLNSVVMAGARHRQGLSSEKGEETQGLGSSTVVAAPTVFPLTQTYQKAELWLRCCSLCCSFQV